MSKTIDDSRYVKIVNVYTDIHTDPNVDVYDNELKT